MAGSRWPFWLFSKGASSSPPNFVHLSRANIETMCELASHGEPLNPHQCRSMSSALKRTMHTVECLVDLVDDISSVCGSAALENFYRVSVKAKQLVENCCREDWCTEAAFQIQNGEAFREILLETSLSYNTIFEVVRGLSQNKEFLFEDLRDSSTFIPPSADVILKDLVALHDRLEGLVSESVRSQHLGKYLLGRVKHALEHRHEDEDFDVRSFNLWADGKGPVGEWSEKSEFLGGNVCKTAWLDVPCAKKLFQDEMQEEEWLAEAKILASLNHPNIVKFLCCNKYETDHSRGHFIAMEQMDTSLGSFIKRLSDHGAKLSLFQALDIMLQIAFGMCYLHENGIAHRDLKPSNVVVRKSSADHSYLEVKVADFGISKVKLQDKSNTVTRPKIGTTSYMPPEAFSNGRANWFKADVYSFSVMCSVILSGKEPFEGIKRACLFRELSVGKRPMLAEDIPKELASVIKEGWAADRNSRPSFFNICTRLEKLRHSLLRDSTSGSHLKQEESGDFSLYIEKALRTRHESRPRILPIQEFTECEELFDGDEVEMEVLPTRRMKSGSVFPRELYREPVLPAGEEPVQTGSSAFTAASAATPPEYPSGAMKYFKLWEGILAGQRQQKPVLICKLEAYRQTSASEKLAADWPPTMQIVRLIAQDYMNSKEYQGKAEVLVFRPISQHGFLEQLAQRKLCAVIQLPSQTLLLASADKPGRMIGMLFPGDMVFKPTQPTGTQPPTGAVVPHSSAAPGKRKVPHGSARGTAPGTAL